MYFKHMSAVVLAVYFLLPGIFSALTGDEVQSRIEALEEKYASMQSKMSDCPCSQSVSKPSFMASLTNSVDHCTKGQPVIFDNILVNEGNVYSNRHGTFTATVSGIYTFSATLSTTSNSSFWVALVKNGATTPVGYMFSEVHGTWHQDSNTVLVHLNANDEVWIICESTSTIVGGAGFGGGSFHSHFSGFLISAD